jgi:hypothetical protein
MAAVAEDDPADDPPPRAFELVPGERGGAFGTISSLYGLSAGIIDKTQFSLLVTVVVVSAVVPTATAERWFLPDAESERRVDRRLGRSERGIRVRVFRRSHG